MVKMGKARKAFQEQIKFQEKVENMGIGSLPLDDTAKFEYHMTAMVEELGEVLKADKRWKTHRNETYIPSEKLEELSDCYITLMNIAIWSGLDYDEVMDAVSHKIEVNSKRLVRGKNKIK